MRDIIKDAMQVGPAAGPCALGPGPAEMARRAPPVPVAEAPRMGLPRARARVLCPEAARSRPKPPEASDSPPSPTPSLAQRPDILGMLRGAFVGTGGDVAAGSEAGARIGEAAAAFLGSLAAGVEGGGAAGAPRGGGSLAGEGSERRGERGRAGR